MIYWQISIGLILVVQVVKNLTGISGRLLVVPLAFLGLFAQYARLGVFDPWAALFTVAVAVLVYDILVFPALETFWYVIKKRK